MASVQLDTASKLYRIRFRFGGNAYFRTLGTKSETEANALRGRVESVINAVTQQPLRWWLERLASKLLAHPSQEKRTRSVSPETHRPLE